MHRTLPPPPPLPLPQMIAAGGSKVTYDYVCTDAAVNSLTHIDYPDLCGAWADPYAATAGAAANFTISCGGFAQLTRYVRLYLTGPDYYKVMATVASRDAFIDQVGG